MTGVQTCALPICFPVTIVAAAAIIMNLVVLSSVMSSMNSGVFSTSRMLFGLSREKQGPQAFGHLNKRAVPANALYFSV